MVRISNNLVGILNFITFLLSIPILAGGIWLSHQGTSECERFLDKPIIALGVFLMVVSLAGLVGACCRVTWLLWVYLLVMFLLILILFCFTIFAFVVTNKGAGEAVSGKGYKEYRLGDYSGWLRKRVESEKNWRKIRSCLVDSKVCKSLIDDGGRNTPVNEFYERHLSAIQITSLAEELRIPIVMTNQVRARSANQITRYSLQESRTGSVEDCRQSDSHLVAALGSCCYHSSCSRI